MTWEEIRNRYPNRWLVIEADEAHAQPDSKRCVNDVSVVEECRDGASAFQTYRNHRNAHPGREFYFVHTSRDTLEFEEEQWFGVRMRNESQT